MKDLSSICLSCGLCCDGTLIGFVQLDKEEIPRISKIMPIEEAGEQGVFVHPCTQLCGTFCKIYDDRPKQCISFQCGMLKKVEAGEQEITTAIESVEDLKALRTELRAMLIHLALPLKSNSFYFSLLEADKILRKQVLLGNACITTDLFFQRLKDFENFIAEKFDLSL